MSFIVDTQNKLDTVARKIQKINPSAANRLFRLSGAVGQAPNSMADAWAMTNVQQMIDAHVIAEQMRAKDMPPLSLRILEWVRNLLIFLPLVLTWYGISQAVSSYSMYVTAVKSNPQADQAQLQLPFLFLWQQGFGGYLPSWLVLSKLAFYDFILLSLLVLLTAIVNFRSHLRSSRKEQEVELVQEELTDALADAALCLANRKGSQPADIIDISRQLVKQLEQERQRIDDLSTRREKELADLKSFTDALVPISQNMKESGELIRQSTDGLSLVLKNLLTPIQQMATDQQRLLSNMGQLLQLQDDTNQNVKQLVFDQKEWGNALEEAIDEIIQSTRSLNLLPTAISQWTNQLSALVNQLSVEHQAQTTVSQMTADVAVGLQDALKNIHQASNELRSMANDFYTIMNIQKDFPNAVKASLNDVIRDYNNAATSVAQGGNNLAYAAKMLFDAANRLNGTRNGQVHP